MPREKEDFRPMLEQLLQHFEGREILYIDDCCRYTGLHRSTLLNDKTFPAKKVSGRYIIPTVRFARWLS